MRIGTVKKLYWLSTFGQIAVTETVWRYHRGETVRPFSLRSALSARGCSRPMQRVLVDFGADEAFAGAAVKVQEHYGVEVAASRVREICLRQAHALAAQPLQRVRTLGSRGPAAIVVETDGTMIPVVRFDANGAGVDLRKHRQVCWQEMRLCAAQAQGETSTHYAATFGAPAEVGVRWTQVARQAGWAANSFIHGVGDGAEWIAQQFRQQFGAHGQYTLDLYHVCEYLAPAAPEPTQAASFAADTREALRRNESVEVIAGLAARLESPDLPDEQAPVRRAHRYLHNRSDQLDYKSALARELPIGSGLIESGNRHVLQARLKIPGAWWKPENAHAMAQLRVCRANNKWKQLWINYNHPSLPIAPRPDPFGRPA